MPGRSNNRNQLLFTSILFAAQISSHFAETTNQKNKWDENDNSIISEHENYANNPEVFFSQARKNSYFSSQSFETNFDTSYIEHKIKGTEAEKKFYSELIFEAHTLLGNSSYIEYPIKYLPDFKISVKDLAELPAESSVKALVHAQHHQISKTLVRSKNYANETRVSLVATTIHEGRHALWQTVHTILSKAGSFSINPYFPDTFDERKKFEARLKEGDDKILVTLVELLRKEKLNKLTSEQQTQLNKYREKCEQLNNYPYNTENSVTFSVKESTGSLLNHLQQRNVELRKGEIVNFDQGFAVPLGDVEILEAEVVGKQVIIKGKILNPINRLIRMLDYNIKTIKQKYSDDAYCGERDAYLHQYLPQSLIKTFYPKLYKYHKEILNKFQTALSQPINEANLRVFPTLPTYATEALKNALSQTLIIRPDNCNVIFEIAKEVKERGEITIVKATLEKLISKGFCKAESNAMLGDIAFEEQQYEKSCTFFKRAIKQGAELSVFEHSNYVQSLFAAEYYKDTQTQAKIALRKLQELKEATGIKAIDNVIQVIESLKEDATYQMRTNKSPAPRF